MLVWTWGRWADVFIDFGRELYVPWRIAAGDVLYRDLAYLNGPLSPTFNALLFALFGTSIRTLVVANIVWIGVLLVVLYRLLSFIGSRFSATVACIAFALLFGFGTQRITGNYNNVCPYSHELTHGILLGLVSVVLLVRHRRTRALPALLGSGFAAGLVFLTKPETFLATAAACGIGLLLPLATRTEPCESRARPALLALAAALAPVAAAFALLATAMPAGEALHGVLGAWPAVLGGIGGRTGFYTAWAGLDFVWFHLRSTLVWFAASLAALLPFLALGLAIRRPGRRRLAVAAIAFVAAAGGLGLVSSIIDWRGMGRPLPLYMLLIAASAAAPLLRDRSHGRGEPAARRLAIVVLAVFALVLLLKLGLYSRIFFYGWALGMPATLLSIVALVDWLPDRVARRGGSGAVVRAASLGILSVVAAVHVQAIAEPLATMTYQVGSGAESLRGDRRALTLLNTLEAIEEHVGPEETLVVMPEGVIVNYLSRRVNPTPYYMFIPLETILYGEETMLAALEADPPDFILFAHRPTPEHGPEWAYFTATYGRRIGEWIDREYESLIQIEDPQMPEESFGRMLLLERRGRAGASLPALPATPMLGSMPPERGGAAPR